MTQNGSLRFSVAFEVINLLGVGQSPHGSLVVMIETRKKRTATTAEVANVAIRNETM